MPSHAELVVAEIFHQESIVGMEMIVALKFFLKDICVDQFFQNFPQVKSLFFSLHLNT